MIRPLEDIFDPVFLPETTQSGVLTPEDLAVLAPAPINTNEGRPAKGNFTAMDLKELSIGYFGRSVPYLRLSNIVFGDFKKDPEHAFGWAYYTNMGGEESRKFKNWLDDNCIDVLSSIKENNGKRKECESKCDSLIAAVNTFANDTTFITIAKWIGEKAAGAAETFAIFGQAIYVFGNWMNNRKNGGNGGKRGDGNGSGPKITEDKPLERLATPDVVPSDESFDSAFSDLFNTAIDKVESADIPDVTKFVIYAYATHLLVGATIALVIDDVSLIGIFDDPGAIITGGAAANTGTNAFNYLQKVLF